MNHLIMTRNIQYPEILIEINKTVIDYEIPFNENLEKECASIQVRTIADDEVGMSLLIYDQEQHHLECLEKFYLRKGDELKLTDYSNIEAYIYLEDIRFAVSKDEEAIFKICTPQRTNYPISIYRGEVHEEMRCVREKTPIVAYTPPIGFSQAERRA